MANAYLRFTVNGVRHSCWGSGVESCKKELMTIQNGVLVGSLCYYRFRYLNPGDIVQIDYVKRRPSKSHRANLIFEVTEVYSVDKHKPNYILPTLKCRVLSQVGIKIGIRAYRKPYLKAVGYHIPMILNFDKPAIKVTYND